MSRRVPAGSTRLKPSQAPVDAARSMRAGRAVPRGATPGQASGSGSTQRIVGSITAAITGRRLMPGTKLSEQKIADIFKVSRTLVRQALHQLSRDRLVVLEPARGAFVASPSVDEARQVLEVRQILVAALASRLCAVITDAQIAALRRHLDDEQAALSATHPPGPRRAPADFNLLLAQILGNAVLAQLLSDLLTRSSLIAVMYPSSPSAEAARAALAAHRAIVDALAQRDVTAAVRLSIEQRLTIDHLEPVEPSLHRHPEVSDLALVLNPKSP